jgi:hypothetical protein
MNAPAPPPVPDHVVYEKVRLAPPFLSSLSTLESHSSVASTCATFVVASLQTEYEDPPEEKAKKMRQLVDIVRSAQNLVVYTGAGVRLVAPFPLPLLPYSSSPFC